MKLIVKMIRFMKNQSSASFADSSLPKEPDTAEKLKASFVKGGGAQRRRIVKMILPRDKKQKPHSSFLRNNATKQENHLWYDFLKQSQFQFNRQRIIGEYIVDFYCPTAKLVIELDGSQHFEKEAIEYDTLRTGYLKSLGLKVLRFTNDEIDQSFESVCLKINKSILSQLR